MRVCGDLPSLSAADDVEIYAAALIRQVFGPLDLQEGFLRPGISLDHAVDDALHPGSALGDSHSLTILLDPNSLVQFLSEQVCIGRLALWPSLQIPGTRLRVLRVLRRVAIA